MKNIAFILLILISTLFTATAARSMHSSDDRVENILNESEDIGNKRSKLDQVLVEEPPGVVPYVWMGLISATLLMVIYKELSEAQMEPMA